MTWAQVWCAVRRGHDEVFHYTKDRRLVLLCTNCGHQSPGLSVSPRPPRLRYEGDPRRHALATVRLVVRKSA